MNSVSTVTKSNRDKRLQAATSSVVVVMIDMPPYNAHKSACRGRKRRTISGAWDLGIRRRRGSSRGEGRGPTVLFKRVGGPCPSGRHSGQGRRAGAGWRQGPAAPASRAGSGVENPGSRAVRPRRPCRGRPENRLEFTAEHDVHLAHRGTDAEIGEARDALAANAAGNDPAEIG